MVAPLDLSFVPPHVDRRACSLCGEPLGPAYWMIKYPDAAHVVCVDWRARPWPYAWALPILRTLYRKALPAERPELARVGCSLRTLEDQWPSHAAHALELAAHLLNVARLSAANRRVRARL